MGRLHLVELEDLPWFPRAIRDAGTDFLRFFFERTGAYRPVIPRLRQALAEAGTKHVVDLCSGGGGPWTDLLGGLRDQGSDVTVTLSDVFPNLAAFEEASRGSGGRISYERRAIDATAVPADLAGLRTMFSAFHHFRPRDAERVMADAVEHARAIAVFEVTQRSAIAVVGAAFQALTVLLATPFIRPFRWTRLLWTYLVPVVPLFVAWDGVVSCLRTYTVPELRAMTERVHAPGYRWEVGRLRARATPSLTYLIGIPGAQTAPRSAPASR